MAKLSTTKRGYGAHHQVLRERLRPHVEAGVVLCARCGKIIQPGTPWDLGHVDGSGHRLYQGPEHRKCNRATATHKARRVSRVW
jgi:hypothetical protein